MNAATRKYPGPPGFQSKGADARRNSKIRRDNVADVAWVMAHGTLPAHYADRKDAAAILDVLKAQGAERARIQSANTAHASAPKSADDTCPECGSEKSDHEDNGRPPTAYDYTILCAKCWHQWSPNED